MTCTPPTSPVSDPPVSDPAAMLEHVLMTGPATTAVR